MIASFDADIIARHFQKMLLIRLPSLVDIEPTPTSTARRLLLKRYYAAAAILP